MEQMHSLLKRQLKRHFGEQFQVAPEWRRFLEGVSAAYHEFDSDREMVERSLDLSSQELLQANSEMRAVFHAIPDLVFRLDHHGTILHVKAGTTSDLVMERQQLVGKRMQDVPLQHVAAQFSEALQQVVREGQPVSLEYSAVVQGQESFYEARLVPLPHNQIVAIIRNITERRLSLRLLASAVEQSSDSIVITDTQLNLPGPRILFVNPAFTRITGYTAEEVLGKTPRLLQGPGTNRDVLNRLRTSLARGEIFEGETINYRKDKTEFHVEWKITPITNSVGQVTHYMGIQRDVTQRKLAEEALRRSEDEFHTLAKLSPVGIFRANENGDAVYWNEKLCRMTGLTRAEALGTGWIHGVHPDDREQVFAEWRRCIKERMPFRMEHRFVHENGSILWVIAEAQAILGADRRVVGYVGTVTDITELKKAQQMMAADRERLKFIFDSLPIGICLNLTRPDGTVDRIINDAHLRICGITREQEKDQTIWKRITHPDDLARQDLLGQKLIADEINHFALDKRYLRPDGKSSWVMLSIQRRKFEDGSFEDLSTVVDITDRKQAEAELTYERDLLRTLLDNSPDQIYFKDAQSRFIKVSETHARTFGVKTPAEIIGKTDFDFFTEDHSRPAFEDEQEIIRTGRPLIGKVEHEVWQDGRESWVLTSKMPFRDREGHIIGTFGISKNITALKQAEVQLIESKKLETVGKLAGGIAHEFNSLLTVILGHCELMRLDLTPQHPFFESINEVIKTTERAAALTRQLLAYGRRQILRSEVLDMNHIMLEMEAMLRPLLGGQVEVTLTSAPDLQRVKADAGQLQQVIVNMAMNAHDAMPNGGKLTLETANVTISAAEAERDPGFQPGPYVRLVIADTGLGMSAAVKARVFEPFFTTKDVGKGVGLGLATCYGIVKQSGGHITVESQPLHGTTFNIYLPAVPGELPVHPPESEAPQFAPGTETVLLVEDDRALREMLEMLLGRLGYTVLAAANGTEALQLLRERGLEKLDLLFTDLVMPQMNGRELAEQICVLYPNSRVLFCSAYAEEAVISKGLLNEGVTLLKKPFSPAALAQQLRNVLQP
jgi:two-component system cell cycle sensor histidine kinase/response regulator CckA